MKKIATLILSILLFFPLTINADSYKKLWQDVQEANEKDLPATQIECLKKIISKAKDDSSYGNLLKAQNMYLEVIWTISPDSIQPKIDEIKLMADSLEEKDPALASIYYAVLGKTYEDCPTLSSKEFSYSFYEKALKDPQMLSKAKALKYEPFIVKRADSKFFNNDLLSLIGQLSHRYDIMHSYYQLSGNRIATMLSALWMLTERMDSSPFSGSLLRKSPYLASLDSLINIYGDLDAASEIAQQRYQYMSSCADVTIEDLYSYLNMAIGRWGNFKSSNKLRNELMTLTCPMVSCNLPSKVAYSGNPIFLEIEARNVQTLKVTTSRVNFDGDLDISPSNEAGYRELKKNITPLSETVRTKKYIGQPEYRIIKDSIDLGSLPIGVYLLEVETNKISVKPLRTLLYVTSMYVLTQQLPDNKTRLAVVDATTGQPVKKANIDIGLTGGENSTILTDDNGEYIYQATSKSINSLRAYTQEDKASPSTYSWNNFSYYENKGDKEILNLFTDRRIYRPGQTVHVTSILLNNKDGLSCKAIEDREFTLTLKGANLKVIDQKTLKTDSYGTASADFLLPDDGLMGNFSISASSGAQGSTIISVEKYVRPTFQVEFPEINSRYSSGDTLEVTAHAITFSGIPVQNAKVKYTIKRSQALWWHFYVPSKGNLAQETLLKGECQTDEEGAFKVEIPMILPSWAAQDGVSREDFNRFSRIYTITATVEVTDLSGETRTGEISLPLSNKKAAFAVDLPSTILRDSLNTITFTLKNFLGVDVDEKVKYYVDGSFNAFEARTNTPTKITWNLIDKLSSGKHTLTAYCEGDTLKQDFIVFSLEDEKPPVNTHDWFYLSSEEFPEDGSPIYLQIGSSDEDVHMLYTAISGSSVISQGTVELSNHTITHEIKYDEKYGSGLLISVAWVKQGKTYTHNFNLKRRLPNKDLLLSWATFRDRLSPGGKEEWRLTITKPNGEAVKAQLLATLYDQSLDDIIPLKWTFSDNISQSFPSSMWKSLSYGTLSLDASSRNIMHGVRSLKFNFMDFGGFSFSPMGITRVGGIRKGKILSQNLDAQDVALPMMLDEENETQNPDDKETSKTSFSSSPQIRENFQETAFFFPALETDNLSGVTLKFTLPESVTSWRFIGLAHDKDMNHGQIEALSTARKNVMVQPNPPRFIRQKDKTTVSSKVINFLDRTVQAQVTFSLKDVETNRQVYQKTRNIVLKASSTQEVAFDFSLEDESTLLILEISVRGNNFSDGERHYLPVLPSREMVTLTMPIEQSKEKEKTYDVKDLFPKESKSSKMTIELTSNPAWLMIGALQYVSSLKSENAINIATAYYANSLGEYILNESPRIKEVIKDWEKESSSKSLKSDLEKNQELKAIALDETPWLLDAINETDKKKELARFFDCESLHENQSSLLEKLKNLQTRDGSFLWFSSSKNGSILITASIVELLSRLNYLCGEKKETSQILSSARAFIESQINEEAKKISENRQTPLFSINTTWINQYLYSNAILGITPQKDITNSIELILKTYKKDEEAQSIYDKAIEAIIKAKSGDLASAKNSLKSLEEYSVYKENIGRYYDSPKASYSWADYKIPTQVAVIEAMQLIDEKTYENTILEMQQWLLYQKRLQGWDTPINTSNAVYAFLKNNTLTLESENDVTIFLDGKKIVLPVETQGLGYLKTSLDVNKASSLTISKSSSNVSWGAIYTQSYQDINDIKDSSQGFSIKREFLLEDGSKATNLKVGDKIKEVITITSLYDYDFVQITSKSPSCLENINQLSGYFNGYYREIESSSVNYFFDKMTKGTHIVETEFYVNRAGTYLTGTCQVQSAYSPEFSAQEASQILQVE